MSSAFKHRLLAVLLGAVLVACDSDGTPAPVPPSTIGPRMGPPTPARTAAVVPATPAPTIPALAGSTPTSPPASPTPLAPLATPDRAALTPPTESPAGAGAVSGQANRTSGLVYLAGGNLTFYDADHLETRVLVDAAAEMGGAGRVDAFVVAPPGDRLAYLLRSDRGVGSACRRESQLWLVDLHDISTRRQLAADLLPPACAEDARARVVREGLAFLPDGRALAYLAARGATGPVDLWLVDSGPAPGGAPRHLAAPTAGLLLNPLAAPDGQQIAFLQASDLGTGGSYDADLAVVACDGKAPPTLLAAGHALPGNRQALPPFALTWLDARTLAFQSWDPVRGPDGTWVVDTRAAAPTARLLTEQQAGLGAWSPAGGPRLFAYRVAGRGLYVTVATGPAALLVPLPEAGATGAISPVWSADGSTLAFSTPDGRLLLSSRATPGPPTTLPLAHPLRAAWSAGPAAPPLLAALPTAGQALALFDRAGAPLASTSLAATGSPQALTWEPAAPDVPARRLAVRYRGGPQDRTPALLLTYTATPPTLAAAPGPIVDDTSPLQWITITSLPEP